MNLGPENSSNIAGGGGGDGLNVGLLSGIPETSSNITDSGGSGASNTRLIHVNVPNITAKIDVIAPAGQLGIVVKTRPAGEPAYICTINADSPIIDQVHLGNKVVAVDNKDIRVILAVQISKLLMRKSKQTERKITVHRRVEESTRNTGGVADDIQKLQIVAPPGNLGIVVESSPVDGHAYVCEISKTSNLFG